MLLQQVLDYTPRSTISTIQFESEALNTIITSLLTTLVIANLCAIINRLVSMSNRDVFSFRPFARSYIFLNSDDPLRMWYWFRGHYDFRAANEAMTKRKVFKRYLISPLCARLLILIVSIGSIALALPSEKRLDACSQGDYIVVQKPLMKRPGLRSVAWYDVCTEIPLKTRLGTVRSSASYCFFMMPQGSIKELTQLASFSETLPEASRVVATFYHNTSGLLVSMLFSGDKLQTIGSQAKWKTESGDTLASLIPSYDGDLHLRVIADAIGFDTNQTCSVTSTARIPIEFGQFQMGVLDCEFDAGNVLASVTASLKESFLFQKVEHVAPRARMIQGEQQLTTERRCVVDVTVTRPIINIVPLICGLSLAFGLNMVVRFAVSCRGNVIDSAFHIVREVLGHDTGSNPLQIGSTDGGAQNVTLRKYVCADGLSAHIGFIRGYADMVVDEFIGGQRVGRCIQVANRGPRYVTES